ncbi:MAG: hypothetical protein Aurels2KO_04710 [Aureliella sp.]
MQRIANCFLLPTDILPSVPGQLGFTLGRTAVATAIFAVSLSLMRFPASPLLAAIVIPLWCATVGTLVDGKRGFYRGIILSMVYPMYAGIILAAAAGVYFLFLLTHMTIAG